MSLLNSAITRRASSSAARTGSPQPVFSSLSTVEAQDH
jgi:hypothetical protein